MYHTLYVLKLIHKMRCTKYARLVCKVHTFVQLISRNIFKIRKQNVLPDKQVLVQ